jgi:choline dehydrogenase
MMTGRNKPAPCLRHTTWLMRHTEPPEAWRGRSCGSSIQSRSSSVQNLIANGILERPLTQSKQTIGTTSNREKSWVPCIKGRASHMNLRSEAKKRLIATLANSKILLTYSKHSTSPLSNRNKFDCFSRRSTVIPGISRRGLRSYPGQHLILFVAMPNRNSAYDYIVVGAGSAGCVLAARLTENPETRVLLLEAGGPDNAKEVRIPAAFSKLFKTSVDWNCSTEEEPYLNRRRLYWPRGKMLGGSSSMNAMIYMRGNPLDYDHWKNLGNDGWGFPDVLPYFKKSENQERGASEYHGSGGPLSVSDLRYVNPLTRAFLAAAEEIGIRANPDFNGAGQDGAGLNQVTQKNGRRHSAADAYLRPALARPNLNVVTRANATRVLLQRNRATGVAYVRDGVACEARGAGEVILAAGTIHSAQLLLLSGIGPADELKRAGVQPLHDLPGVGKNLQDHPMVSVGYLCKQPVSLASAETIPNFLRYLLFKRGPLVSNVAEAGIFWRTRDGLQVPDMQLLFGPAYYRNHGLEKSKEHAFGFGPTLITPESRGSVTLRSADPFEAPTIRANYLSHDAEMRVMIRGVRLSRELAHTKAFEPFRAAELHPGARVTTDEDIAAFLRAEVQSLYHPVGTCKMGSDPMAVVDARLRVRGLEALRVVDASIMPRVIAGNTNAPTIMIAEKAADMIREQA